MNQEMRGTDEATQSTPEDLIQVQKLESLARKILGEDIFKRFVTFLLKLFYMAADFEREQLCFLVAVITRRCHVLLDVFLQIFEEDDEDGTKAWYRLRKYYEPLDEMDMSWAKCQALCREYFVTDTALLSFSDSLAKYFYRHRRFPRLIICDELLIHGRALNDRLLRLEESVSKEYRKLMPDREKAISDQLIKAELSQALTLYIFTKNDDITLLLPRFCMALKVFLPHMPKDKWRALSMYFSRLISIANVNNVSYSWSFIKCYRANEIRRSYEPASFRNYTTKMNDCDLRTWLVFYPKAEYVKAVCTIREKDSWAISHGNKFHMYVPFIMYDRTSYSSALRLHDELIRDIKFDRKLESAAQENLLKLLGRYPDDLFDSQHHRWLTQTNDLFLSYLLMRRFLSEANAGDAILQQYAEDQLARNFVTVSDTVDAPFRLEAEKIRLYLNSILAWKPENGALERYLDILTAESKPLWTVRHFIEQSGNDERVENAVLDAIAELGLQAERNAYEYRNTGSFFGDNALSSNGISVSIGELIRECVYRLGDNSQVDLGKIIAYITHAMDLGLLGMTAEISRDQSEQVYPDVKAGEQALFIHPLRYCKYNEALEMIEQKYRNQVRLMEEEVLLYVDALRKNGLVDNAHLAKELVAYMREIQLSGQSLSEWRLVSDKSNLGIQLIASRRLDDTLTRWIYKRIYESM